MKVFKRYLNSMIPAAGTYGLAIRRYCKTWHTVFVARQRSNMLVPHGIPYLTLVIIVTSKQHSARIGKGDRCHATIIAFVRVDIEFAISAKVEQTTGCIIWTCSKGTAVGEKVDCVNIRLMGWERLHALFFVANVPHFGCIVACTGYEYMRICLCYR